MKKIINSREIAYLACLSSEREERFISESLQFWYDSFLPSKIDYNLAQEIAYGTCRMSLSLNYFAQELVENKLNLKRKEKILLFTALYQYYYLERIPLYAIANETIEIAKKYCSIHFIKFLNVIFRNIETKKITLPQGNSIYDLSVRYSYPQIFIKLLLKEYSHEQVQIILEAGNLPPKTFARLRSEELIKFYELSQDEIEKFFSSVNYYIQNPTPAFLINHVCKPPLFHPKKILDLCSSPGGKLIACHDLFPNAELYANDISEKKIKLLQENLNKYQINAHFFISRGEEFKSDTKFDLIILDVPCSNTGVLNKRAEARWRLTEEHFQQLAEIQMNLLKNASQLLHPHGQIWYMTCSILANENEKIIASFIKNYPFKILHTHKILPDFEGNDGGFACSLGFNHEF